MRRHVVRRYKRNTPWMSQWFFLSHSLQVTNHIFWDNLIMLSILKEGGNKKDTDRASTFSATTRYCVLRNLKLFGNVYDFSFVISCFVRVQWRLWKWNFGCLEPVEFIFPQAVPVSDALLSLWIARKFRKTVLHFVGVREGIVWILLLISVIIVHHLW